MPPADPAFRLFPSPHPPTPFPAGRGRSRLFLCKGLPPLASPGLNPSGTGCPCRTGTLAGGLSGWLPARPATAVPNGSACRLCRLLTLPSLSFLPPSPKGKDSPPPALAERSSLREGGDYKFILPGASPLASRGLDGARHWLGEHWRYPARGSRLGRRIALPPLHPAGWGKQSGDPEDPPRGGSAAGCRQIVAC